MSVRRDSVFISSLLLTIALVCMVPSSVANARVTVDNMVRMVGFSSIAIISIGLVVTWMGYVKRVRWTWLIMLIIVWVWAFPGLVLPALSPGIVIPPRQILSDAFSHPGLARGFVEGITIFLLMVIGLLLPIGSFIRRRRSTGDVPGQR